MNNAKPKTFNEWFPGWPKARQYEFYSKSQGTGLRRAHSLMTQASRDYDKYIKSFLKSKPEHGNRSNDITH